MTTMVVAHGAWSAGWVWKKMHPLLAAHGVTLVAPTYTGLGERRHLGHAGVDLETHISDLCAVLEAEDLRDVVLVAHSYGGMVGTGVADRARDRIRSLIYLDAFVPSDGQCLFDLIGPAGRDAMEAAAAASDNGWQVPPNPPPPDTSDDDVAWITPRRSPQPVATFRTALRLGAPLTIARSYIYCSRTGQVDTFGPSAAHARSQGWPVVEIDASHSPHVTAPERLTEVLIELSASG